MGGFFGATSHRDVSLDVFFGVDYHSHLGTKRAGMCSCRADGGFEREIHSIANTPFRTKFENDLGNFAGPACIGCISDKDPQPLIVRSHLGLFALAFTGIINNKRALTDAYLDDKHHQFTAMSDGGVNDVELIAALINQKDTMLEGIINAQNAVEGTVTLMIMQEDGSILCARDIMGRLPILLGKDPDGYAISFESFAYQKLGYQDEYELGPGEVVKVTADGYETLKEPGTDMKICAFLWSYYGYPNSTYEGVNVEVMRYRNGAIMSRDEEAAGVRPEVDYVAGIPDSGLPHAIGYAQDSGMPFARPFVKYTPTWPRSFMPGNQALRNKVAHMKQVPVHDLIKDKKLLFVDDSIVRGTQLRETVEFLYENGAKEVHMRSACPPIMYGCKYLSFSTNKSDMDLIARRKVQELEGDEGQKHLDEYSDASTERGKCLLKSICEEMKFDSLRYQSLEGLLEAIGLPPEKVCTYCWSGKE